MPDASDLLPLLKRHWGFERFRPFQAEAVRAVLQHRDSVVVLPTGGGKSLCYQAPAVFMDGLAVIVSPLISLMKDQVDSLQSNGIAAASVNSSNSTGERLNVANDIRSGRLKLLYVSPERLCTERTLSFLEGVKVSFFAIDEAHCISQWGHDFRPEYRMLSLLKERFAGVAVHAYTATATEPVRKDIASQLNLSDPLFHVGSFDRPNLTYRVEPRGDITQQIHDVIGRHKGESGIIYCISRKQTEEIASELTSKGMKALPYHAGLPDVVRAQTQDAFQKEVIDVVVATVAFGMGIDKSNVRFVVHAGSPKSLEHYQQESGRAGRDGLEAECVLHYGPGDFLWWKKVAEEMPPEARGIAKATVKKMEDYCQGVTCRHRALVEYFGQEFEGENCAACDVCLLDLNVTPDALVVAQKILSCVVRLKERFGAGYTAQVLCGSSEQRIVQNGHDKLTTWGLLKDAGTSAVRLWIEQLVSQGYCEKYGDGDYQLLRVTPSGWKVLRGEATPRLLQPPKKKQKKAKRTEAAADLWAGVDQGLFEALRALRREVASERGVPAFVVFDDQSLRDMARRRPTTLEAFLECHGVGEKKQRDFGEAFVGAIVAYCEANKVEADVDSDVAPTPDEENLTKSAARHQAFSYFEHGMPIDQVAERVNRAFSTTRQYLVEFIAHTGRLDAQPWVDEQTQSRVEAAIPGLPQLSLNALNEHFQKAIDYDSLQIVLACWRNRPTAMPK
ncbi:MAG: DNA helicase RecQ [Planctomycetaceae bacterium]|nr:DNA helicase RecQ [Planctomycetaceae bacterium]